MYMYLVLIIINSDTCGLESVSKHGAQRMEGTYFGVTINNRRLTLPASECYKIKHSVVGRVSFLLLVV